MTKDTSSKRISKAIAATTAGKLIRKLIVNASFLLYPLKRRYVTVVPDLLIPGSIANPWNMPSPISSIIFRLF